MRVAKFLMLVVVILFAGMRLSAQSNAYLNILSLNGGQVTVGGTVDLQVSVGNSGPNAIAGFKVRVQVSVPTALVMILSNGQQTGLPMGWTIQTNSGGSIIICNGTDVIPANVQRQIFIKLQGVAIGGPSTINGTLLFSNGTNCNITGSLAGDQTSDNTGTTSIQVIAAPSCSLTGVTATAGTITCNGGTTTITATPSGTSTGIEYSLNNGTYQTSNIFTVGAGTYTITAREISTPACTATAPAIPITEPAVVSVPVVGTITQPTCTVATGSVVLSGLPAGNWTINPGAITGSAATVTINDLAPGTYHFTVTNAQGCQSPQSGDVTINAQPLTPAAPVPGTISQPTCAISTGSVVLNGLPIGNWTVNPGTINGSTPSTTVNNLNPNTYNFTVTNADGCTSPASADVIINDVPGAPASPLVDITQPTCTVATGHIAVTSSTAGLTFSLDGGPYVAYPITGYDVTPGPHTLTAQNSANCTSAVDNITINAQPATPDPPTVTVIQPTCTIATATINVTSDTTAMLFSLDGGTYAPFPPTGYTVLTGSHTLVVKNVAGCIAAPAIITVNAQPVPPTVSATAGIIPCFGGNATLTVAASGGTGALEYSLDGITYQPGNIFNVNTGTYTVIARDANLCTGSTIITVSQPAEIVATPSTGTISCNGGTSTLTIASTGGVPPLQYSLNGGPFQSSNIFIVGAGNYTITIKDANGCTNTTTPVTVTQPNTLITSAVASRISRCGGTSEVVVTASGGITPYASGIGTFTRGPGTWIFSVTDASGCTDTAQVTIDPPGCMDLRIFPNPAKNSITINHSVAEAGAKMQLYEINGALVMTKAVAQNAFETTMNVDGLASGVYVAVFTNGGERQQTLFRKITQ